MTDAVKAKKTRTLRNTSLIVLAAGALSMLAPAAFADYAECLGGPRQTDTLRNPLVPGAPSAAPGQVPTGNTPLVPGSGPVPNPVIPGDYSPNPVGTGYADPTNGSIFPVGGSQGTKLVPGFVPGAGRYPTKNGQQQGMYDYGQGMNYGQNTYEPGSGNAGTGTYESGANNGGQSTYDYGQGIQGTGTYESGANNGGAGTYESGGQLNGQQIYDPGVGNGGTRRMGYGGSNGGTGTYDPGTGNGGTQYMSGATLGGGTVTQDPGTGNGGTQYMAGGAGNGGTQTTPTTGSSGAGITNNGGARNGAVPTVNNGGPAAGAQDTQDTVNPAQVPSSLYDFQGPLPTVRTFCRYLVILGVVVACIWVAMAAISVVMGNQNGPARVIGAVGGLLLLLAGYTIWKIVQMDTFHANSTGVTNNSRGQQPTRQFNGPVNPLSGYTQSNPGQTTPIPQDPNAQQDPKQTQGPYNYRPTGPYTGHQEGPDRVGSYNIYPQGIVPQPPKMPVINSNVPGQ